MAKRKIIEIDRELCNGCGLCTTACVEGALELDDDNKAVLVKEIYCDGLGACLDVCPTDALKIVERESEDYDAQAAYTHVSRTRGKEAAGHVHSSGGRHDVQSNGHPSAPAQERAPLMSGCPGSAACKIPANAETGEEGTGKTIADSSELRQWPIQLHLISPYAPYFKGSDLLIAADCTAFSMGSFHPDLLLGKKLVIACPKLDETEGYVEKLAELIKHNGPRSLTVAIMTVPCCSGLNRIVERAVEQSGTKLPIQKRVIHLDGRQVA
ncbi:MAG: 4Fe-4S dicluster domain-containing protein [Candidatus Aminicenantales bacterium]